MVRLITLKLQPVTRPVEQTPLPPLFNSPPPVSTKSPRRPGRKMLSALSLPRTQNQWRIVLDEVRATYLRRQYRQCSVRCIQLLECAPNMVHSLHCIYLSFYAAICLELLARPLSVDCPEKLPLFNLARVYYQKTEQYMLEAESGHVVTNSDLMGSTSLEIHDRFSSSSSNSSEISCMSSVTSATDSPYLYQSLSPMHSPASSVCSSFSRSEDESCDPLKPQPLRVKKIVSFHLSPPSVVSSAGNDYNSTGPTSPRAPEVSQSRLDKISSPPAECFTTPTQPSNTIISDSMSSFLPSRSIARCSTHLTTLRTQLKHHLSTITELIASIQNTQYSPSTNKSDHTSYHKNKRGSFRRTFDTYNTTLPDITESEREEKARHRASRIVLLKQRGVDWKLGRGRFDGSRYERLCDEALRELQG